MGILDFLARLAEIVLAIELLVVVFAIAAICVGIWYGLRFTEKRSTPLFDMANGYVGQARMYENRALRMVVAPFIALHAVGHGIGAALEHVIKQTG